MAKNEKEKNLCIYKILETYERNTLGCSKGLPGLRVRLYAKKENKHQKAFRDTLKKL